MLQHRNTEHRTGLIDYQTVMIAVIIVVALLGMVILVSATELTSMGLEALVPLLALLGCQVL